MRKMIVAMMVGIFILGTAARGQTQAELNEESAKDWKKADEGLNAAYKQLMELLDDEGKKKLRTSQRAWIAFRDAECESCADEYRGGSIMPLIYNLMAKELTEKRTAEMSARVKEIKSH